ncbi:MAG: DUF6179 domain-containing protein [Clostridia bacterium]|nr:DUF6179 domain-containing protein [Clostridia bacterium]
MELGTVNTRSLMPKMRIKKENLDPGQYTLSLMKEGLRLGLLDRKDIQQIQIQTLLILQDLIERYTKGESSSIRVDTAEGLLNSIYYSIDAWIARYENPENGLEELKRKTIREIYQEGLERVSECLEETEVLYWELLKKRLEVSLEAYNATLEAFPAFFQKYGAVFNAQDTPASIDYPLVFDNTQLKGIFYIRHYLETLHLETQFCRLFQKEEIEKVLISYGKICRVRHTKPLVNIFELIINNSVFSVLSGGKAECAVISPLQLELIENRLGGLSKREVESVIEETVEQVIEELRIDHIKLIQYIHQYKTLLIHRIFNAMENNSLHNIVLISDEVQLPDASTFFQSGERMSDASFRAMVRSIVKCTDTADKIEILISSIRSLEDFIDVLGADCLFEGEYISLYSALSDVELAALGRLVFYEELRESSVELISAAAIEREAELEWQAQYTAFLRALNTDRIEAIEKFMNETEFTGFEI